MLEAMNANRMGFECIVYLGEDQMLQEHPANEKVRRMILLGLMVVGVWICTKTLETKKAQTSLIRVFETRSHECPGYSSSHSLRVGDRNFTRFPSYYPSKRVAHHASRIQWQPGDSNAAWQVCLTWAEASSTSSWSLCNVAAKTRWLGRMVADTSPSPQSFLYVP